MPMTRALHPREKQPHDSLVLRGQFRQRSARLNQRLLIAALDLVVNLLTMHRNRLGRLDAKFYRVALDAYNFDPNISRDHNALACFSGKNEHGTAC